MFFGGKKRVAELEAENLELRQWLAKFNGMDAIQVAKAIEDSRAQLAALTAEVKKAEAELESARSKIVETDEVALLQEVGIYRYRHPLDDAVAYQSEMKHVRDSQKGLVKDGGAVLAALHWTVNGSRAQGQKMTRELSRLMLRAYNSEADNIVRTLRPHALASAVSRLDKARETIARLGTIVQIRISDAYHRLRVHELELTADYLAKVEEEKERLREERARQREEEKAIREMEAEKHRLQKEESHYQTALDKLRARGDEAAIAEVRAKISEIQAAISGIESREANIRAGYVYIISNFGSFGGHMVKIGLTRRLDPVERVRELGDASVPFGFDVHALVFSDDAVGLESRLHERFADRRVNLVNLRREYFYASPREVCDALKEFTSQRLLEFHEVPDAIEWRASGGSKRLTQLLAQIGAGTEAPAQPSHAS